MNNILTILMASLTAATPIFASSANTEDSTTDAPQTPQVCSTTGRYQKVSARTFETKFQASDLISAPLLDRDGKNIGSVIDLELTGNGWVEALYVELNDGVFCVFGNSIIRIDYDSIEIDPETRKLMLREHLGEEFQNFVSSID